MAKKMRVTEIKRGDIVIPTSFESPEEDHGEVVRGVEVVTTVVIHYANGIDERHDPGDELEVIS